MIFNLLLALLPVGVVLVLSEYLWRRKILRGEHARKFIHILSGVWIAFWPFYLPFDGIFILGSIALTLVIYSRITRLFHAIYAVKRKTYGDVFFALAIIFCAYLNIHNHEWVFTVSILFLALADGGAAVAGKLIGKKNTYYLFGFHVLKKSVAGTVAYIVLAYVSLIVGYLLGGSSVMADNLFLSFLVLPVVVTLLENTMPYGLDNLATPLFATILLNTLS